MVTMYTFTRKIQRAEAWGSVRSGPFLGSCFMSSSNVDYMVVKNMTFEEMMPSNLGAGSVIFTPFASVHSAIK